MLTAERRNELWLAAQVKAIRVAIYEVGYMAVALFGVGKAAQFGLVDQWFPLMVAGIIFLELVFRRYRNWKSVAYLEKTLDEDFRIEQHG